MKRYMLFAMVIAILGAPLTARAQQQIVLPPNVSVVWPQGWMPVTFEKRTAYLVLVPAPSAPQALPASASAHAAKRKPKVKKAGAADCLECETELDACEKKCENYDALSKEHTKCLADVAKCIRERTACTAELECVKKGGTFDATTSTCTAKSAAAAAPPVRPAAAAKPAAPPVRPAAATDKPPRRINPFATEVAPGGPK